MKLWWVLLALVAGLLMPVQAGLNVVLSAHVKSAEAASLMSFFVGTLALALFLLVMRIPLPLGGAFAAAPLWAWLGGVLGAFFVTVTVFLAPKLGAGMMMALLVAGQMLAALLLDHHGVLGFPQQVMSVPRVLGAILIVVGVILIRRF